MLINPKHHDEPTRNRLFWQERVARYERELAAFHAGNAKRERAEIEADLARCLAKLRNATADIQNAAPVKTADDDPFAQFKM